MSSVSITVNGRSFTIACDPEQKDRVLELGAYIDKRVQDIASAGAASSDAQLMVLTSLVLTDEIFELQESLAQASQIATQQEGEVNNEGKECIDPQELENLREQQKEQATSLAFSIAEIAEEIDDLAKRLSSV